MKLTRAQIVDGTGFAPDVLFEQVSDYEGWSNRETWAVALFINNEQGMQEIVHEALREMAQNEEWTGRQSEWAAHWNHRAGEIIQEEIEQALDPDALVEATSSLSDALPMLRARNDIGSLYRVDWDEIGAAFLADIADES